MKSNSSFKTVDEYIQLHPKEIQELLYILRQTIQKAAPDAEESISYNMPAYKQLGPLVYFAGYKNHIGFYPTNSGVTEFKMEIKKYTTSKGAIQFPLDEPLPVKLITQIVKFRLAENKQKDSDKKQQKRSKK